MCRYHKSMLLHENMGTSTAIQDILAAARFMDQHNIPPSDATSGSSTGSRRARSASQPVPAHPIPGPSNRGLDTFDFNQFSQYAAGSSTAPTYPLNYDEAAFTRALLALQGGPPVPNTVPLQQAMPPPPPPPNMQAQNIPNPTQALLAALPWLQYLQMQSQYGHLPPQLQQYQYMPPPAHAQPNFPFSTSGNQMHMFGHHEPEASHSHAQQVTPPPPPQPQSPVDNTPSPEAGQEPSEGDTVAIVEDKRRRNTAASARFRIKKKQWTLNLERTISDLSGRVQELEGEASELRRENGWLKEIVMLKSKRLQGVVPDLGDTSGGSTLQNEESGQQSPPSGGGSGEGKGKEKQST